MTRPARLRGSRSLVWQVAMLASGLVAAGCLQVEVTVDVKDEGGAAITERVRFSPELLELDRTKQPADRLERLLERDAIDSRAKEMGKDVTVVSHKVSTLQDGSRESVAVYSIPDLEELRFVNPHLAADSPGRVMRLRFQPIYKVVNSYEALGDLVTQLVPAARPKPATNPKPDTAPPPPPTPANLQMLRDLEPVFAEAMKGFAIRLRLVYPTPIPYGAIRDRQSGSRIMDFISFTDKDLDAYGRRFLDNEELMLSLLRLDFGAANISDHVQGFPGNATLPVFRGSKPYMCGVFRVHPTKSLFQKYFAGRPKSQGGDLPDAPGK